MSTPPLHHRLDVYGTELHAAFGSRAWAALRRRNPDLPRFSGLGLTHDSLEAATGVQHVWVLIDLAQPVHADPGQRADTVAHEASHVAAAIFARNGIPIGSPVDEPFAYLVGWVAGWLWRGLLEAAA